MYVYVNLNCMLSLYKLVVYFIFAEGGTEAIRHRKASSDDASRGKRLHQHLRNDPGFSMASPNGFPIASSNILSGVMINKYIQYIYIYTYIYIYILMCIYIYIYISTLQCKLR